MSTLKERALNYYEANELRVDMAFFLGGFIFDVLTLSGVDDLFTIGQQIVYLLLIGLILSAELLNSPIHPRLQKIWDYRSAITHFVLGSLLSVYSLFFLKSASIFNSIVFVALLMLVMVANELKNVQASGVNTKIALYVICLFSFFSLLIPTLLGFVGWVPFLLTTALTSAILWFWYRYLLKKINDQALLLKRLLAPGGLVIFLFFLFYLIGWIPPVPLAVQEMGVYHNIKRENGSYVLYHENPWWKPWNRGDQDFAARSGDKIFLFAKIFSPARFDDTVILHWQKFSPLEGKWLTTDKIPLRVTGGREDGYRGFASKSNYTDGDWRVGVETTDGREIGRISFFIHPDTDLERIRNFERIESI